MVPLHWDDPSGETIPLFVKRYRTNPHPRGQLWLLNGGPGGSGVDFEGIVDIIDELSGDLVIYMPDHRGTGRAASRLGCPVQEAETSPGGVGVTVEETADCFSSAVADWGDALDGFTITEAARDIGELIERTRYDGDEIYLYGVSYGTVWAQRYLHWFPDQADGVVLDSICSPGACEFALQYDTGFDENGHRLLDACAADPDCASRLGGDPWTWLGELHAKLDDGHCPELELDRAGLRQFLALLSMDWVLRDYLPAMAYRIDRCEPEDIDALEWLAMVLAEILPPDPYGSVILGTNISFSEFIDEPAPSLQQILDHVATLYISRDAGPDLMPYYAEWPRYPRDEYHGQYPSTSTPLLLLNGTLDPQTPLLVAQPAMDHYSADHQTAVVVERSAHGVLLQSPLDDFGNETCGIELISQFVRDSASTIDTSCRNQVRELHFNGSPQFTEVLLGTADAWDNDGGTSSQSLRESSPQPAAADAREALEDLRKRLRATSVR
jgi:pimeloyl-ACP methyl ester carboxylesterase